jgi:hypothetical protein
MFVVISIFWSALKLFAEIKFITKKNKWLNSYVTADFVTKKMEVVQMRPYLKDRKLKKMHKNVT